MLAGPLGPEAQSSEPADAGRSSAAVLLGFLLLAGPPTVAMPIGGAQDRAPSSAREPPRDRGEQSEQPPTREELLFLLRSRDRAIRSLRFAYREDVAPDEPAEVLRWTRRGSWAFDRGRIASTQWFSRANHPDRERVKWTSWDGSRSRNVDFGDRAVEHSPMARLRAESDPSDLEPQHELVLSDRPTYQRGALNAVVANNTGLFFNCELWSQRLGRTQDMEILGWEELEGARALKVLFDASEAPGAGSDGRYGLPYCVWFDLETLLPRRIQMYVERERWAERGTSLMPTDAFPAPAALGQGWVPLRFYSFELTRQLDHGLYIALSARTGAVSTGTPFMHTLVQIQDPVCGDREAAQRLFEPPVAYPLQVIDEVADTSYVLKRLGGEPYSTSEFAFWEMLRDYGPKLGGAGEYEIEHLFVQQTEGLPCAASALLFLDRVFGRSTSTAQVMRALPEGQREEQQARSETVSKAARALGFEASTRHAEESELARLEGVAVIHLRERHGESETLHFALCWRRPQTGDFALLHPGVRFWTWSLSELEASWTGELSLVRPRTPILESATEHGR